MFYLGRRMHEHINYVRVAIVMARILFIATKWAKVTKSSQCVVTPMTGRAAQSCQPPVASPGQQCDDCYRNRCKFSLHWSYCIHICAIFLCFQADQYRDPSLGLQG